MQKSDIPSKGGKDAVFIGLGCCETETQEVSAQGNTQPMERSGSYYRVSSNNVAKAEIVVT